MYDDDNSTLINEKSKLNVKIVILETSSLEPNEKPGTCKGEKRKLSVIEEELEQKLKTSESKLVAFLEINSQLRRDLTKVRE